jgi:hypothetical protein
MRTNVAGLTRMVARPRPSTLASSRWTRAFLVDEIRGWSVEPGGAGLRVLVVMLAEHAAALVNPETR